MASTIINYVDEILSVYFGKDLISEYRKIRTQNYSDKGRLVSSLNSSNRKQLESELSFQGKFQTELDTLITFALNNLSRENFIQFLFNLGERAMIFGELTSASIIYEQLLGVALTDKKHENAVAYAYLSLGDVFSRQARWRMSVKYILKAKKYFMDQQDLRGSAKCENLLGTIYGDKGNLSKAKEHFEKSLSLLNQKKDLVLTGMLEMNLGILNNMQGRWEEAFSYYQRALIKYEKQKDNKRIAELKHNIGMLYSEKGEFNSALKEFDASITYSLKGGNVSTLGISYLSKAYVYTKLNDLPLANAFADKSMDIFYKINDRLSIADVYKIKGMIERSLRNFELAENYFLTGIRINRELENVLNHAETAYELGLLYLDMKNEKEASAFLKSAVRFYKSLGNSKMVTKISELHRQQLTEAG